VLKREASFTKGTCGPIPLRFRLRPKPDEPAARLYSKMPNTGHRSVEMDTIAMEQTSDLGQLYERHSPRAFRLAYLLTGDRDAAEDLVKDAFVKPIGRASLTCGSPQLVR